MSTVKPISPNDRARNILARIPDEMVGTINELLARGGSSSRITVLQEDIIALFIAKWKKSHRKPADVSPVDWEFSIQRQMFKNHWLDFEPVFIEAGWHVVYDKPGYNESGNAYFEFSKKE